MWEVYEHRSLTRRIKKLPVEVLKRYEVWKDIVRVSGPQGLLLIKGFSDEALRGEWKGYRSSRLGLQFRVIYKLDANEHAALVVNITAHDYRRK